MTNLQMEPPDLSLVQEMLESATSHREIYDKAQAAMQLAGEARHESFEAIAIEFVRVFRALCLKEADRRFVIQPSTLYEFAAQLQHWYENE